MSRNLLPAQKTIYTINDPAQRGLFFSIIYGSEAPLGFPRRLLQILEAIRDIFVIRFQMSRYELSHFPVEDLAYFTTPGAVLSVQIKGPRELAITWGRETVLVFLHGAALHSGLGAVRRDYLERIVDTQPREIHKVFRTMNFEFSEEEWEEIKQVGKGLDITYDIPGKSGKRNLERERAEFLLSVVKGLVSQENA